MKHGHLSAYFKGAAAKLLSAVEAHPNRSNQHEFNGSNELMKLLGSAGSNKQKYPARLLYVGESAEQTIATDSSVTWYDARARSAERTGRSEHRLYFPTTEVTRRFQQDDLLLIAKCQDESLLVVVAEGESTIAQQLHWLFGLPDLAGTGFRVREEDQIDRDRLGVAASLILEQIGIEADLSDEQYLEAMLSRFGDGFPTTRIFSAYARETLSVAGTPHDPDAAITSWMEREEVLFRTLEKHLIGARLRDGFMHKDIADVDDFLSYSLSVQNRRKARAGAALENHLEHLFKSLSLAFDRGAVTERNNRPDFLFPGAVAYRDREFPSGRLTMLAAKTTAKDRWRQVTKEADRIILKHLLTLEPAISGKQTEQMRESGVQLVVPAPLHEEYAAAQRSWLINIQEFIDLVRTRNENT